jgi:hypothetical protein
MSLSNYLDVSYVKDTENSKNQKTNKKKRLLSRYQGDVIEKENIL